MTNLPTNPDSAWTPSLPEQQERSDHRMWIGGRAVALLNHYWRDDDPAEMTAALGRDWADVLEGLPRDAIQKACIQYQRSEPRRKPTPGAIYALARENMPRPVVVRSEVAPRLEAQRCSAEAAQEIVERAGYAIKRMEAEQ